MVPMNNTTMEPELQAWLPAGSGCITQRIPRGKGTLTPDDLPQYIAQAMKLADRYASDDVDLVVYGCTAAGFMMGPARDAAIAADLNRVTGKPVVTTASAMIEVLRHIGARNVALVTPYSDMVSERLRKFVEDCGMAAGVLASFRAQTVDELAAITPGEIAALARATMTESCDAMFIACSQLPTCEILDGLERDFGRPVWSSIRATAWQVMRERAPLSARG
jgi:maleate cis-trans isomerase